MTTQTIGTRTSLAFSGAALSTLASGTYVKNTTAYPCNTNKPQDVIVEVNATTTNTPSGNKKLDVFIVESLDGTNFRSGPTSGTTTTREQNLRRLGSVHVSTASTAEMATFSVMSALGYVPYAFYIVVKNDLGVALTAGTVFTAEVTYA